jgi:hypothetical protein
MLFGFLLAWWYCIRWFGGVKWEDAVEDLYLRRNSNKHINLIFRPTVIEVNFQSVERTVVEDEAIHI